MEKNKERTAYSKGVGFSMKSFDVLNSEVSTFEYGVKQFTNEKFRKENLEVDLDFGVVGDFLSKGQVGIFLHVRYAYNSIRKKYKDEKFSLLHVDTLSLYEFSNFNKVVEITDEHFSLPIEAARIIMSIAYSTTRGIIHMVSTGRAFSNPPLPIVNPKLLLDFKSDQIKNNRFYVYAEEEEP